LLKINRVSPEIKKRGNNFMAALNICKYRFSNLLSQAFIKIVENILVTNKEVLEKILE